MLACRCRPTTVTTCMRVTRHVDEPLRLLHWRWQSRCVAKSPRGFGSGRAGDRDNTRFRSIVAEKMRRLRPSSAGFAAAAMAMGSIVAARALYDLLLANGGRETQPPRATVGPRRDESRVTVRIGTASYDKAKRSSSTGGAPLLTPERLAEGSLPADVAIGESKPELKTVDADSFASFVRAQRAELQTAKRRNKKRASDLLRKELKDALLSSSSSDAEDRIASFADWYFAYQTTYTLLGAAMGSAAKHAISFRTQKSLSEAVIEDIRAHVERKYEALVLRPAITDPLVHRALVRSLRAAHSEYTGALRDLEASVSEFLSKEAEPYYSTPPRPDEVVIDMDWSAQMQKVEHLPLAYEKNPKLSLAIVAGGAVAGKAAGGAAVISGAKILSAKLAAPFATKAAGATLAKAATGAAAGGAALGGPVGGAAGAALGAAIGLGVDLSMNAGVALMQRSAFERDVRESLLVTILEWEERLLPELEKVQDVWYGHAEALLRVSSTPEAPKLATTAVDKTTDNNTDV